MTDEYHRVRELLRRRADIPVTDPRNDRLRDEAIEACLPLAGHIAQRYRERGESMDDLIQVARVGLVHAVDRFDPSMGTDFLSFAVPTITGEVRRHFRDRSASIRIPRSAGELRSRIREAEESFAQVHGRMPGVAEIAEALDEPESAVRRAQAASAAQSTVSLDGSTSGTDDARSLLETVGSDEPGYEQVERSLTLRPALRRLPERNRRIVGMRFFERRSQSDIARRMGISQMHVSRLLASSLGQLRTQIA
ncbi:siderophore-interacting protein [Gordonia sp. QH-12]|uniref:SigB/SigF/SigG family RNA polymerase sigma factor n=1 Tax=Gordonia sp. QH-12 TaxID=1437876 RepID=UPI000784AC01|nr:SigB/SigF/SigG family RNA polymerase sigma factor [Gordonia sp. QH-12]KXT57020.1 siderophore-interacting protein [Gordonia sp. QH-12]